MFKHPYELLDYIEEPLLYILRSKENTLAAIKIDVETLEISALEVSITESLSSMIGFRCISFDPLVLEGFALNECR